MCLIITGQSSKVRSTLLDTTGMLSEIYSINPDGIGVMYSTSKGLKVVKTLPKNVNDAHAFIKKLPTDAREIALHFRWTTHGDTDLLNCHPYDVVTGYVAMMHNGVLHTGNAADKTKSDTWHFINDYLKEAVHDAPNLIHTKGFLTMLADFIGDNRFVFMDGDGRMSHVNYDQGIEHDGLWFSNTYAWKPATLIPHYYTNTKHAYARYNSAYDNYLDDEYEMDTWNNSFASKPLSNKFVSAHSAEWQDDDHEDAVTMRDMCEALIECDVDLVESYLDTFPVTFINTVFNEMSPIATRHTKIDDLVSYEQDIYKALLECDLGALHDFVRDGKSASVVAEVMCYYIDWYPKMEEPVRPLLPAML
jgi:predicted glutamine amidotransferase